MQHDYPVIIVGGGPVGMVAAAELGLRNIPCLLLEQGDGTNNHPRANVVSPRSMEHFRRWGIDEQVIAAGLPVDYPTDIVFTTRMTGKEILRFAFPSIARARNADADLLAQYPEIAHSPYFKTAVGQNHIEPVLRRFLQGLPSVQMRFGARVEAVAQQADGATLTLADGSQLRARYVLACDGAKSTLRHLLDIPMDGKSSLGQNVGVYIRAPDLLKRSGKGGCILYWTLAPDCTGVFIAIDGREHYTMQRHILGEEELEKFDARAAVRRAIGDDVDFEIITIQPWVPRQLVAQRYRDGNVFLLGDAAHLLSPTGGFGMNTGIGDAVDIGWKLAGVLQGWADAAILDSYEIERRPIAWRNAVEATDNRSSLHASAELPAEIEDDTPRGEALRAELAEKLKLQRKHFAAVGIHLGYRYEDSPICIPDGTPAPPDDPQKYLPVARPGSRAPHCWLGQGQTRDKSILDLFGHGFTLLRLGDASPDVAGFQRAAEQRGMPLAVQHVTDVEAARLYGAALVLVRPDGHVAWRGDAIPADPLGIIDRARGAGAQPISRVA
ncbi:FAD-dependent oxidoreductase [Ferrovibrio sp.]|uniref:FAD-dependent oxidoreductase n=1 Tax=Ferrovibrio sp. TaxID=1917215 RepID=UPI0025BEC12E|nr:FAD-dependent oxidoreductase [Ferrovibrio sp.]MBX3453592.1 FAD-dependent oxidoreductase [Ferrovibrio sp.]